MYIYLNMCKQMIDVKLLLFHSGAGNHLFTNKLMVDKIILVRWQYMKPFKCVPKKWAQPHLKMLSTRYVHHHHHHVVLVARISLTLSRHFSLSFIASGRSSGQHPASSHSCWMYVRAGRPAFARPCVGVYKSTSLMSLSLLLQQCPACLVRLTWIVFVMGGR